MLQFGNKEFRNLQEQVLKNAFDIKAIKDGLNIIGVGTEDPDESEFDEGQAYLQGSEAPYKLWIKIDGDMVDMGLYPAPGIQGVPGPQGNTATLPTITTQTTTVSPNTNASVQAVIEDGILKFRFQIPKGSQGIKGEQGLTGPTGAGEPGPQGPQGESAPVIRILGYITSTDLLPDPDTIDNGWGYLVGDDLYIIIGADGEHEWFDLGPIVSSIYPVIIASVSEAATSGTLSNSSLTEVLALVGEPHCLRVGNDLYTFGDHDTSSMTYYQCTYKLDPIPSGGGSLQNPCVKFLYLTKSSGAWYIVSRSVPKINVNSSAGYSHYTLQNIEFNNTIFDVPNDAITEISTKDIYLYNEPFINKTGVYRLTYNGTVNIHYSYNSPGLIIPGYGSEKLLIVYAKSSSNRIVWEFKDWTSAQSGQIRQIVGYTIYEGTGGYRTRFLYDDQKYVYNISMRNSDSTIYLDFSILTTANVTTMTVSDIQQLFEEGYMASGVITTDDTAYPAVIAMCSVDGDESPVAQGWDPLLNSNRRIEVYDYIVVSYSKARI